MARQFWGGKTSFGRFAMFGPPNSETQFSGTIFPKFRNTKTSVSEAQNSGAPKCPKSRNSPNCPNLPN